MDEWVQDGYWLDDEMIGSVDRFLDINVGWSVGGKICVRTLTVIL
jgi:hypothetical protein